MKTFKELIEDTDWDNYGVGKYEKCSNCMVHCGFEGTAVVDSIRHPLKLVPLAMRGVKTDGPMKPDIPLDKARRAEFVFSRHVEERMAEIKARKSAPREVEAAE